MTLHSYHVAPLLIILAPVVALQAKEHLDLYLRHGVHCFLFWLLYHSGVSSSLYLFSIPFYYHSTFNYLFFFTRGSLTTSICHDYCLSLLSWVTPSISALARNVFCTPSPWKDLLRFHGPTQVQCCAFGRILLPNAP